MNKIKPIIIYSLLAILCIAAVASWIITNKYHSKESPVSENKIAASTSTDIAANTATASTGSAASSATASQTAKQAVSTKKILNANSTQEAHINAILEKSQGIINPNPIVGVGLGKDYAEVTKTALKNAGGLESIIKKGDTVLIKPNLCVMGGPGDPRITDYRLVEEIVKEVKKLGASKVIIAEGSFSGYTMDIAQYNKIKGVQLIDFNEVKEENCYKIIPEKSLTGQEMFIPKVYMDADVVISAAKLKTHMEAHVTLSLKNAMGVPPMPLVGMFDKSDLHNFGLKQCIVDLNKIRRPDMVVIEGIVGGEGLGPSENTPVDSQIVFAGIDPVATDSTATYYMGIELNEVPHIELAADEKLGVSDRNQIKVVGADIDKIRKSFKKGF